MLMRDVIQLRFIHAKSEAVDEAKTLFFGTIQDALDKGEPELALALVESTLQRQHNKTSIIAGEPADIARIMEFEAEAKLLFEMRAEKYLDAECLAILGNLFHRFLTQTSDEALTL